MDPDEKTKLHEQFINQLDLQNPEVWAKMILDDGEREDDISEGDIILFSLVNRKMMEVDEEFYKTVEKSCRIKNIMCHMYTVLWSRLIKTIKKR